MPLPPAGRLVLTDLERSQLSQLSSRRGIPRRIIQRINIVLEAAGGLANRAIARKLSTSVPTVLLWRKRYQSDGISGILKYRPHSGVRGSDGWLHADLRSSRNREG